MIPCFVPPLLSPFFRSLSSGFSPPRLPPSPPIAVVTTGIVVTAVGMPAIMPKALVLFVLSFYLSTVGLGDLLAPKAFSFSLSLLNGPTPLFSPGNTPLLSYLSLLLTWRPRDSTTPVTSFLPTCTLPHLRRYPLKALSQLQHLVTLFTALSVPLPATPSYRVSDCLLHTARIVADARPAHASPLRPPAHRLTTR